MPHWEITWRLLMESETVSLNWIYETMNFIQIIALDLTVEELIATLMTPTEQKFYPIELFAPTALKSSNPNEGPGAGMDIRNSFGDVFTHIHRQTYGHIDPLGTDQKLQEP